MSLKLLGKLFSQHTQGSPLPSPVAKLTDEALAEHLRACVDDIAIVGQELNKREISWIVHQNGTYDTNHIGSAYTTNMEFTVSITKTLTQRL